MGSEMCIRDRFIFAKSLPVEPIVVIVAELYPEETITHKDYDPATRPMNMQVKLCDQPGLNNNKKLSKILVDGG